MRPWERRLGEVLEVESFMHEAESFAGVLIRWMVWSRVRILVLTYLLSGDRKGGAL
jgi:hypothetical protein